MPGVWPSVVVGSCLLAGVAGGGWAVAALAAGRVPRLAPLDVTAVPADGRKELRVVIAAAIRERGAEAVPWESLEDLPRDCDGPGCFTALARATAATHVLRIQGGYADEGFRVKLQLWEGGSGRLLASDARECEICTLPEMYRVVGERVSALAGRAFERSPRQPPPPAPRSRAAAPAPPPIPGIPGRR